MIVAKLGNHGRTAMQSDLQRNAEELASLLTRAMPEKHREWRLRPAPTNQIPSMPKLAELAESLAKESAKRVEAVATRKGALDPAQFGGMKSNFHKRIQGGSGERFEAIRDALYQEYPFTQDVFFRDVGAHLQYLEGEVALRMMSWAMGVPLLPVHDSFAVPKPWAEETERAMQMCWKVVMRDARASGDLISKAGARAPAMHELSKAKRRKH